MSEESKPLDPSEGGKARWKGSTKEERSEAARKAAQARWSAGLPAATHEGILEIADIPCFVLEDGERVITTRGVMKALGRRWRGRKYTGTELPVFLEANNLKPFIGKELAAVLSVVEFRTTRGNRAEGFKAKLLPLLCETYLSARDAGVLTAPQLKVAGSADILMRGLAHVGIIALVDEATGYQKDRARDALAKILEAYIAKELRPWVPTFDPEFYEGMFRLKGLPFNGTTKRPRYFGHLTNDIVYDRLAPGVKRELQERNPVENGRRKAKNFQWLTGNLGHPKLVKHLGAVTALMSISKTWDEFYALLNRAKPKQIECPLYDHLENDEPLTADENSD
jgi:P63C domain